MSAPAPSNRLFPDIHLEYLCSYWATLTPPEMIGPTPEGLRVNVYVTSGEVFGPKLRGRFRPVGGDWLLIRPDGIGVLDVRATMELDDGALVYTTYGGVAELGPDGYAQFMQGKPPASADLDRAAVPYQSCGLYLAEPFTVRRYWSRRYRAPQS